ncbi:hypothetical protein J5N97_002576 [Dioscorea zingiberensis]|uniref:Peptidase A2 domain-containing protein n=1 Tax=Dioscorea zingiberensis TaxID=325984 RepID=A0A9D5D518_9LILI|nr:hypothetical protein J5N97_002576 [Dioscorea zingiberensis]
MQELPPQKKSRTTLPIEFTEEDLEGICQPQDDALVVVLDIGIFRMHRVLVDTGSSADIIFWDVFDRMKIGAENLKPCRTPLAGFTGDPVYPEGIITLPVTLGTPPRTVTAPINFLVVRHPSSYNAIMGRPSLNKLGAVPSTYHLKLKFQTDYGHVEVKGDQPLPQCYLATQEATWGLK